MEAVQESIWESAVDIVAANIPANSNPTKNSGSNFEAKIGKASSGSRLLISGINNLDISIKDNNQWIELFNTLEISPFARNYFGYLEF